VVAERTEKLRETVEELEAFSYSVAHDMRAPLRGMQGFARILLDDHAGQLGAEAHNYLERIASSVLRMDLLIQDVLNYTQMLRVDARLTGVDLDRLARDILATYPDWQPPKATIQIVGTLPMVLGHPALLTQCISNLLSKCGQVCRAHRRAPGTDLGGGRRRPGDWRFDGPRLLPEQRNRYRREGS